MKHLKLLQYLIFRYERQVWDVHNGEKGYRLTDVMIMQKLCDFTENYSFVSKERKSLKPSIFLQRESKR